jgi:predicted molibdopterin-dependent oxidoreductase YjgC
MIATELATRLGHDLGFGSVTDITDEIAAVSGLHSGVDAVAIASAVDGLVVPIEAAAGRPAAFVWEDLGEPLTPPPHDSYAYRLVIDRTMYDCGTLTAACPSLVPLSAPGRVRLNGHEGRRLGVTDGSMVRLSSKRASVEGRIVIDDRVGRGIAAVAHNHDGLDVRSLVEMGELVTDVRIETL